MAACRSIPAAVRQALDNHAVAQAKRRCGPYANEAYKHFTVTGVLSATCSACGAEVRGKVDKMKAHVRACQSGTHRPSPTYIQHFKILRDTDGKTAGRQCRFCDTILGRSTNHVKLHLSSCAKAPKEIRQAMDEEAVDRARRNVGAYGINPLYRKFDVIGFHIARCHACHVVVRGGADKLRIHLTRLCSGVQRSGKSPDCTEHFVACRSEAMGKKSAAAKQCRFCGAVLTATRHTFLRLHLGVCSEVPAHVSEPLDRWALECAKAKVGAYGRNPLYERFEIVGWLRARCKACRDYVRGNASQLRYHLEH